MKKLLCMLSLSLLFSIADAQVGIGTLNPAASAQLEVQSTSKGFLPPRMTLAQRDAMPAPVAGLQIWCTNCGNSGETQVYNGMQWTNIIGGVAASLPIAGIGICGHIWMSKNLDVAFYRNGDPIPKMTDPAAWAALTTGAYCYYNNDSITYAASYGKLYNWYALNDIRGLAPAGWHVPNAGEFQSLTLCTTGGAIKQVGTISWASPNTGANNNTHFTALPGGSRNPQGTFFDIGFWGSFWGAAEFNSTNGNFFYLSYNNSLLQPMNFPKNNGLSVRCIKD